MKNILVSIIIPVYNTGEYLYRCIDSVINQSLKEIEIILIDDGSTDNSGMICDEYKEKDNRVHVIHKTNEGVSIARNKGILLAKGNYVGFVDSDDWIEPNMFERLLYEAENTGSDIAMCDATTVYDEGKIELDTITQLSSNRILKKSDFTPSLLLEMAGSACRCIYKNDRYIDRKRKHQLKFPLNVKFSEDRILNLYALGQAKQMIYIKKAYYNRYINKKSAVHRFHEDYFEAYKKAANAIEEAIKCVWADDKQLQKAYLRQLIGGAFGAVCNYYYKTSTLSVWEKREKLKILCDDQQLRAAIKIYGADRKSQLILNRRYIFLIAYAKLENWKYRR